MGRDDTVMGSDERMMGERRSVCLYFRSLAVNMYFMELCELLLFDDNRSAFHILLKYFEEEGGIELLKE